MKVSDMSDIYAVGDIAYLSSAEYERGHPQVAQVAIQQAMYVYDHLRG